MGRLSCQHPVFFDLETTGFDPATEKLVMAQVAQPQTGVRFALDLRGPQREGLIKGLTFLEDEAFRVAGFNLKFDLTWAMSRGVDVRCRVDDLMLAEIMLDGDLHRENPWGGDDDEDEEDEEESDDGAGAGRASGGRYSLKAVAARYGVTGVSKEERNWFVGLDTRPEEWAAPFPDAQVAYGLQDVEVLAPIHAQQRKAIRQWGLLSAYHIEMRALPLYARMELDGIHLDVDGWRAFIAEKQAEATAREDEALAYLGGAILRSRIRAYDAARLEWQKAVAHRDCFVEGLRNRYDDCGEAKANGVTWGDYKHVALKEYLQTHPVPARPKLDTRFPNLGSGAQLVAAFEELGIPVPTKKNAKGEVRPTFSAQAIEKTAEAFPQVAPLNQWKKAKKFVTAFGEKLLAKGHATDYTVPSDPDDPTSAPHRLIRINSDYRQIGAGTGRTSCRNPNFQQIPSKGDGKRIRRLVRARPGYVLLTGDFSNMELRILAHYAGRGAMYDALVSGKDLHSETARMMFALGPDVDPKVAEFKPGLKYRDIAKVINFGLVYGMSAFKLSKDLNIPPPDAEKLIALYFAAYPEVKRWLDRQVTTVRSTLKSRTLAGRWRRYRAPEEPRKPLNGRAGGGGGGWAAYNEAMREYQKAWGAIERKGKNTPIQGSSADITKLALALVYERLDFDRAHVVAVVHDEIVTESSDRYKATAKRIVAEAMEEAFASLIDPALVPPTEVVEALYWSK